MVFENGSSNNGYFLKQHGGKSKEILTINIHNKAVLFGGYKGV
jgi:hypothetical protein